MNQFNIDSVAPLKGAKAIDFKKEKNTRESVTFPVGTEVTFAEASAEDLNKVLCSVETDINGTMRDVDKIACLFGGKAVWVNLSKMLVIQRASNADEIIAKHPDNKLLTSLRDARTYEEIYATLSGRTIIFSGLDTYTFKKFGSDEYYDKVLATPKYDE